MEIDDEKYLVAGVLCLGFIGVLSVAVVCMGVFIKKEALRTELMLNDFNTENIEDNEWYDFSADNLILIFDKNGIRLNDEFYYYNHFSKTLITDNEFLRINIYVVFYLDEENALSMRLDSRILKVLERFNVELNNQKVLEYIINNKEEAFKQIYTRGYIYKIK